MKKVLMSVAVIAVMAATVACGNSNNSKKKGDVATATEEAAQNVGDAVEKAANDVKDAAKEAAIDKIDEAANAAKDALKKN